MSPLCVSAVDVVSRTELLHSGQAAFLGGVQQGGVTSQQILDVRVSVLHQIQRGVTIPVLPRRVSAVLEVT